MASIRMCEYRSIIALETCPASAITVESEAWDSNRSPLSTPSSHRRKSVWIPYAKPRHNIAARPGNGQCCRRRYSSDGCDRRIICRLTDWRRDIHRRKRYGQRSTLQFPRSGELAYRSLTQRSDSCVGTNQPSSAQRGDPPRLRRVAEGTLLYSLLCPSTLWP